MVNGYLYGSFDLFSVGDLDIIQQAAQLCDHLTVGVLSDEHVGELLGRSVVIPLAERMEIVRSVRGVDQVESHEFLADASRFDVVFDDPRFTRAALEALASPVNAAPLRLPAGTNSPILRGILTHQGTAAADVA